MASAPVGNDSKKLPATTAQRSTTPDCARWRSRPLDDMVQVEQDAVHRRVASQRLDDQGPAATTNVHQRVNCREVVGVEHRTGLVAVERRHPGVEDRRIVGVCGEVREQRYPVRCGERACSVRNEWMKCGSAT